MPIDSLVWYFKSMEDFNCVINKTNNIFHFSNTSHVIFPWINVSFNKYPLITNYILSRYNS